MKRILVPSDFSACADNALLFAFNLAKDTGAEILLLHSYYPAASADMGYYNTFMLEEYLRIKEKSLVEKLQAYKADPNFATVEAQSLVEYGFPAQSVCEAAVSHDADIIVMGTTGASGLKEIIMGSTTGSVVTKSKVPVLALPVGSSYDQLGSDFVFSTDFKLLLNTKSKEVFHELIELKKAKLTILHQVDDDDTRKKVETGEIVMSILFHDVDHTFDFLDGSDLSKSLNEYIDKNGGSLLCLVSHQHGFFEKLFFKSLSREVAHHTRIPLLVLQEK
jgi:nucleotide-binding universal stress UspA family protein